MQQIIMRHGSIEIKRCDNKESKTESHVSIKNISSNNASKKTQVNTELHKSSAIKNLLLI